MRSTLLPLLCLLASPTLAQDLTSRPDLAPGVAALPRLPEATAAATSINARLAEQDAEARSSFDDLAACDASPSNEFTRDITLTLISAKLIGLQIVDGGYCAPAAHPWTFTSTLTFDRQTGQEVDPRAWLPAALAPKDPHNLADLAPLTELYIATEIATASYPLDPECHDVLRHQPHGFDLWPDAAAPGLDLTPTGLAHVFTSCENPVTLPLATLRRLGFAPELLEALTP